MEVPEDPGERVAGAAEEAPEVREHPTDRVEETAWMDGMAGMDHRGVAEGSP